MSGLRAPRGGTGPGTHAERPGPTTADALRAFHAADRLVPEDLRTRAREAAVEAGQVTASDLPACGVCRAIGETHAPWCSARRSALQSEATDLLALTADYPVEHPLRQAAARLTTRLALAEGKIATATAILERAAASSELSVIGLRTDQALEILKR